MSATRDVVDDAEDDDACVFIASIARVFVRARKPRVPNARESVCVAHSASRRMATWKKTTCATHGARDQQCTEGKVSGVAVHHVRS